MTMLAELKSVFVLIYFNLTSQCHIKQQQQQAAVLKREALKSHCMLPALHQTTDTVNI